MNGYLFEDHAFLRGYPFPLTYLKLLEIELPDIDPWWWLAPHRDISLFWADTLREQFPRRRLVPFAKDGGSDDVACFDGEDLTGTPKVLIIHSFCSPGYEHRGEVATFTDWLLHIEQIAAQFRSESQGDDSGRSQCPL